MPALWVRLSHQNCLQDDSALVWRYVSQVHRFHFLQLNMMFDARGENTTGCHIFMLAYYFCLSCLYRLLQACLNWSIYLDLRRNKNCGGISYSKLKTICHHISYNASSSFSFLFHQPTESDYQGMFSFDGWRWWMMSSTRRCITVCHMVGESSRWSGRASGIYWWPPCLELRVDVGDNWRCGGRNSWWHSEIQSIVYINHTVDDSMSLLRTVK